MAPDAPTIFSPLHIHAFLTVYNYTIKQHATGATRVMSIKPFYFHNLSLGTVLT